MAYFANGTEGDIYESRYCNRCAHRRNPEDGECCPILMLHLLWNYEQNSNVDKALALDLFIPRDGIHNKRCEMFIEHAKPLPWEAPASSLPHSALIVSVHNKAV